MTTKTFIIAEAGVNHNGSLQLAKRLVDVAAKAGADAVKFQTFKTEKLVTRQAPKANYQQQATGTEESQYEMLKRLELSEDALKKIISYCQQKNILFLSSPFDLDSIDLLHTLGIPIFKIPSGEITNLPYLRKIGSFKKEVILSTGMSDLKEIGDALDVLVKVGTPQGKITVLHCNTEYPTPMTDVNLRAMATIASTFDVRVGYSDHTLGIEVPIAAIALGARVIEKHFTIDKNMAGPDHKASLEPEKLEQMVLAIRNIELVLGSYEKKPSSSELPNRNAARKSIVAATAIRTGELFSEQNLTVKRPGAGISPMRWDEVIGRRAPKNFSKDQAIRL